MNPLESDFKSEWGLLEEMFALICKDTGVEPGGEKPGPEMFIPSANNAIAAAYTAMLLYAISQKQSEETFVVVRKAATQIMDMVEQKCRESAREYGEVFSRH